jgi:response regulator RpfG family c-di-GMP phosphodiesterase
MLTDMSRADTTASSPRMPAPRRRPTTPAAGTWREGRILLVDDDDALRDSLRRFFELRGYDIVTVPSGEDALSTLQRATMDASARAAFTVMLCDIRMPGMDGLELLPNALVAQPDLAVIMLTATNDASTATQAITHGATDYVTKPVELDALEHAVDRAHRKRRLLMHQRQVDELIREEAAARARELERGQRALRTLTVNIAEALVNAMEAKDPYMRGRSHRVSALAASVAHQMGLSESTIDAVRLAAGLMEIGRIGIREEVLNKPGKLTPEEYAHVQAHVAIGMEILAPLRHLGVVLDYIHDHHEHYDGSGYPRRLAGEAISLGGRILAAVDAFDAVTTGRAHQQAVSPDVAIAHLRKHVGTMLDPLVFEALRAVVTEHRTPTLLVS